MQDPTIGDTVDRRFELRREIARGGMGSVFEAEQRITGRRVAIKVALGTGARLEQAQERLLREARAITVARHPGIVELLDAGVCEQIGPYLVLDLLHGCTLDVIIRDEQQLPVDDVVHIGRQMCEALEFTHSRGVIHRDLKPSNVFLAVEKGGERVKLFDFGIAEMSVAAPALPKLTDVNQIIGTPEYMAPELLLEKGTVDHRCDVYAAGVTLFECLTGQVPYAGTYQQVIVKVATGEGPPSLRKFRPEIDQELDGAIVRALAVDPDERYQDAASFAGALVQATGLATGRSSLIDLPPPSSEHAELESSHPKGDTDPEVRDPISEPIPLVRRKHPRVSYVASTRIERADGAEHIGESCDIGEGGLLVRTPETFAINEVLWVRLALPDSSDPVTLTARVRHCDNDRGTVGLQFLALPNKTRIRIAQYVETQTQ